MGHALFHVSDVIARAVPWSRSVVPKVVRRRRGAGWHVRVPRGCGRVTHDVTVGSVHDQVQGRCNPTRSRMESAHWLFQQPALVSMF